jgi:sugar lactone lactonase YvrE
MHSANCNGAVFDTSGVGAYTNSESPYGTYNQGGNVSEWTDSISSPLPERRLRGGNAFLGMPFLSEGEFTMFHVSPQIADQGMGFRVASVPPDVSSVNKMYWTNSAADNIQRADLDGSNVEELVTGLLFASGIALDLGSGKMYWTDTVAEKIQRADLDGSNVENVLAGLSDPDAIALDLGCGKMYWTDAVETNIQRADLDGSNVEELVTGLSSTNGIALDSDGGKMYWTDSGTDNIQRADLDGSDVEELVTGLTFPNAIALDLGGGKMYWTDVAAAKIQRADLDGSNVEDVLTGLSDFTGIALGAAIDAQVPALGPGGILILLSLLGATAYWRLRHSASAS